MPDYRLGVPSRGKYRIIFCTDDKKYGGDGKISKKVLNATKKLSHGKTYSIPLAMPKMSCVYLVKEPEAPKPEKPVTEKKTSAKKTSAKKSASATATSKK